jgi:putative endonuclease
MKIGYVYIISDSNRNVLYTGVTNNIKRRISEHKAKTGSQYARLNGCTDLMFYEEIDGMLNAIKREKLVKKWQREWKWELIKKNNPYLLDLAADWELPEAANPGSSPG